jgi:thiol-disulfide isomerase/thioredoxin
MRSAAFVGGFCSISTHGPPATILGVTRSSREIAAVPDFATFAEALPYDAFFEKFGQPGHRDRWERTRNAVALAEPQVALLKSFKRECPILMLAGTWCGDCAGQCPILEKFAELAPVLKVRYLDRDAFPDVQKALQINGGNRVPVAVFFSEDGHEVARFGERTLTQYRRMVKEQTGEGCGTGIVPAAELAGVAQDWLDAIERVQHILRLSPRLRRLHGD